MKNENLKFTFDDILLTPSYSENDSRKLNIGKSKLFDFDLDIPIISSPMDTVTGLKMISEMRNSGGIGVHHRYCDISELKHSASFENGGIAISPSVGIDDIVKIHSLYPKTFFLFDVAHADTKKNLDFAKKLKSNGIDNIVTGNLVTLKAVEKYLKIGINVLRVGVGSGSVCLTRVVTGFGYPQGSAIQEIYNEFGDNVVIISDGGHKTTGDIVKAFSLGAKFVMLGRMLSGTIECAVQGEYRGMASKDALMTRKSEFFVEGDKVDVKFRGSVKDILSEIKMAIEQGCFYGGVDHYTKLIEVEKIMITGNAYIEGNVRKEN